MQGKHRETLQPHSSEASDKVSSMSPWGPDSDPAAPLGGGMRAPPTGEHAHIYRTCPRRSPGLSPEADQAGPAAPF